MKIHYILKMVILTTILIINNYLIRKINYSILNRNLSFFMTRIYIYIYIYFKQIPNLHFCERNQVFVEKLFVVYAGLINILLIDLLIKYFTLILS
jgi:hypothetical protein